MARMRRPGLRPATRALREVDDQTACEQGPRQGSHLPDYTRRIGLNPPLFCGIMRFPRQYPSIRRIAWPTLSTSSTPASLEAFRQDPDHPPLLGQRKGPRGLRPVRSPRPSACPGKRDKVGNVVVRKPATAGREGAVGAILQGHLDMVCEKNSDTVHDFCKDPIRPEIKRRVGLRPGHDARRRQRHRPGRRPGGHGGQDARPRPARVPVHGRRGDRPHRRQQDPDRASWPARCSSTSTARTRATFTIGCAGGADSTLGPAARTEEDARRRTVYRLHVRGLPRRPLRPRHQPGPRQRHQAPGPRPRSRPRPRPSSRSSASRAAASTTPSPARPWPCWPARRSRSGRMTAAAQEGLRQDPGRVQGRRARARPTALEPVGAARTSP
ncbi:MAG: hypothetical protein M0C28_23820 [Candidatus Moduliflexus flocculans]|nr:hypothetical protein [Candidatus Moduliflexus flocculans]